MSSHSTLLSSANFENGTLAKRNAFHFSQPAVYTMAAGVLLAFQAGCLAAALHLRESMEGQTSYLSVSMIVLYFILSCFVGVEAGEKVRTLKGKQAGAWGLFGLLLPAVCLWMLARKTAAIQKAA